MIAVTYTIELLQPLLATGLEGDPNSKTSLDYVPGSMVRGALIGRILQREKLSTLDVLNENHRRLFFSAQTRFLNAYPTIDQEQRSLPTPASWLKFKKADLDIDPIFFDYAVDPDPIKVRKADDPQVKGLTQSFHYRDRRNVYLLDPVRRISIHTARHRKMGRATTGEGAVFQYDALGSGQRFSGVILTDNSQDASDLEILLTDGDLWLGGSRSAGYGRVKIVHSKVHSKAEDVWQEVHMKLSDVSSGSQLAVMCLSPCIVRDDFGALSANAEALAVDLARHLKLLPTALTLDQERTRLRVVDVGGFNRTWGLPTSQAQAIDSGSVIVFRTLAAITANSLRQVQDHGIGEQQIDGFGRIVFNWNEYDTLTYQPKTPTSRQAAEKQAPAVIHTDLTRRMAERLLRRELDRLLAERVQKLGLSEPTLRRNVISNSQLERFRVIARSALPMGDLARLTKFLDNLKQPAREQFENARFEQGSQQLMRWIRDRLEKPEELWQKEFGKARPVEPITFGSEEYTLSGEWAGEYTIRLIDAVLAQAVRDKKARGYA